MPAGRVRSCQCVPAAGEQTVDEACTRMSYAAGCRWLGENKVQEAYHKWESMADLPDLRWSVIGHLQINKAKLVARFAAEFQALTEHLPAVAKGTVRRFQCTRLSIRRTTVSNSGAVIQQ